MNTGSLYVGTVLIWGSTWFAINFQLGAVLPEISLIYRFGIASILLFGWRKIKGISIVFGLRDHASIILLGSCLFCFNYLLFYLAAGSLTSGLLALIFSTMTGMNIINGTIFLGRRAEIKMIIGVVFGFVGICCVFLPDLIEIEKNTDVLFAIILSVIATYLASLGNIISAYKQSSGIRVIPSNAFGMLYGTILMAIYALIADSPFNFDVSLGYITSLMYLSVLGSAVGFTLYLTLVGEIGPAKAAYATVLFPVVALTLSTLFEGYRWTIYSGVGALLVLIGNVVVLMTRKQYDAVRKRLNLIS